MKTSKVQHTVQVGDIEKISGEVNIAAGNIIKRSNTIYERALTAAEEAKKARLLEGKLLAEGVGSYIQQLQDRAKNKRMTGLPYKGLLEYRLAEAESFHGRKQAIESLLKTLEEGSFAVLHAESGAGKTSLIQAGITPRILAHGHLPLCLRPYDKSPSLAIKQAFLRDLKQAPILAEVPLRDFLCQVVKILGKKTMLYIILDQFEEFFLRVDEKEQAAFINELGECIDDNTLNVQWLISLRSEYFGRLASFRPRIHNPYENDFLLNRLTREEAREAIILPAQKYKIEFEHGLVDQILDDLGGEKIVPPQLQLVCSALYETLSQNERLFTKEIYKDREGGADGILRGHLERVLKRLPANERTAARQILEALITSVQQRALRPREELIQSLSARGFNSSNLQSAIDQLVDSRLLRVEESDAGPSYELAHDYLLNEIKIDPKVVSRKQAEELLEQGLINWHKHRFTLSPGMQKLIEAQKDELFISPESATMLFLSAVENGQPAEIWADMLSDSDFEKIKSQLNRNPPKMREAMWAFRKRLPVHKKSTIFLWKYSSSGAKISLKWIKRILVFAFVLLLLAMAVFISGFPQRSNHVLSFNNLCLKGKNSNELLVSIDQNNPSRIIAMEPSLGILCQSLDTAATWSVINFDNTVAIRSIAADGKIYLASDHQIFWMDTDEKWQQSGPLPFDSPITRMILDSEGAKVIVSLKSGTVLAKSISNISDESQWKKMILDGVSGEILDITVNHEYFAVSTTEGVWYTKNAPVNWQKFEPSGYEHMVFTSVSMTYHKKEFPISLINPLTDDYIMAVQEGGGIYTGALTENRLNEHSLTVSGAKSVAVNGTSVFIATDQALACSQVWYITDKEWFMFKWGEHKPCK